MPSLDDRIDSLLRVADIEAPMARAMRSVDGNERLLQFISAYVAFNRDFAGGVAHLAAALQSRTDLFRDLTAFPSSISDRSAELATYVFVAAIDEFWDRESNKQIAHRQLAQDFLTFALRYFNVDAKAFDALDVSAQIMTNTTAQIARGYNRQGFADEKDLFYSIGFHIGSEFSGSIEYKVIDRFLSEQHPGLVDFLKSATTPAGYNAYRWLSLHIDVEMEHFRSAMQAAKKGTQYYVGRDYMIDQLHDQVIDGIRAFKAVQSRFFTELATTATPSRARRPQLAAL